MQGPIVVSVTKGISGHTFSENRGLHHSLAQSLVKLPLCLSTASRCLGSYFEYLGLNNPQGGAHLRSHISDTSIFVALARQQALTFDYSQTPCVVNAWFLSPETRPSTRNKHRFLCTIAPPRIHLVRLNWGPHREFREDPGVDRWTRLRCFREYVKQRRRQSLAHDDRRHCVHERVEESEVFRPDPLDLQSISQPHVNNEIQP